MDAKTRIKVELLTQAARRVAYAYYNKATDACTLLERPFSLEGSELIAVVALMKKEPDGKPLIEHELMPGTSEEMCEKVEEIFKRVLLRDGTVELDSPVN